MDIAILTKEYPPHVYGGAGVHVEYLTRELEKLNEGKIRILCFGDQQEMSGRREVTGVGPCSPIPFHDKRLHSLLDTLTRDAAMIGALQKADIIHCHTWYPCQAALFVCPSIYEPFGIINLEAMACETPVVASAVRGIPEVVQDGVTGRLVSFEPVSADNPEPKDPDCFAKGLADAVNTLIASPELLKNMASAARKRVEEHFTWKAVARKTLAFYKKSIEQRA